MMTAAPSYIVQVGDARPATDDKPSAGPIYRHISAANGFPKIKPTTLFELFDQSVQSYPDRECLGYREQNVDGPGPYVFMTYAQVGKKVADMASGIRDLGIQQQQRVGVFGGNCPEWMIAMQACNRSSLHCVPLYDSLGENAIEYIIEHAEIQLVFTTASKLPALNKALKAMGNKACQVKAVVYWGGRDASVEVTSTLVSTVLSFAEVLSAGSAHPHAPVPPSPADICTVMYTSGTTGVPKGVLLTHDAIITCVTSLVHYSKDITVSKGDRMLSYLPLAHIFDRVVEEWVLHHGAAIGYWQGDVAKLVDDIMALQPALFIGVPRVFERIYSRFREQISKASFLRRLLFNWGFNHKLNNLRRGVPQSRASRFFDWLIFSKISGRLGGKVRYIVSGGAPLAPHVEEFLRVAMCCPVMQGYGLTETCAASFIAIADDYRHTSTVGPPTPCTEFRLESIIEMGCDALHPTEPRGEVLIRSGMLFSGYYKMEEQTREVLEGDGWFHTGDIAVLTPSGAIRIVDRKKNIFKLSQGEYIAVEKVEATFKKCLLVEQIWVYGNSFKSCLVAVVVPTRSFLSAYASQHGLPNKPTELCANERLKAQVLAELSVTGKAEKLKGFEMVKAVHLEHAQFTVENDLMTPTFKLKRPQLLAKYQSVVDSLYASLKE